MKTRRLIFDIIVSKGNGRNNKNEAIWWTGLRSLFPSYLKARVASRARKTICAFRRG